MTEHAAPVPEPVEGRVWIHEGDNLEIIRGFADESFTLIYLDPPFNTGRPQAKAVETARSTAPAADAASVDPAQTAAADGLAARALDPQTVIRQ